MGVPLAFEGLFFVVALTQKEQKKESSIALSDIIEVSIEGVPVRQSSKIALVLCLSILCSQAQSAALPAPISQGEVVAGFVGQQVLRKGFSTKSVVRGAAIGMVVGALVYNTHKTYKTNRMVLALDENKAEDLIVSPICLGGSIPGIYPLEYCGKSPSRPRPEEEVANGSLDGRPVYSPAPDAHIVYTYASAILATNMSLVTGGPGPLPPGCDAHHIVPAAESRKWAKNDADAMRGILQKCKIDINDEVNGVYLPSPRSNRPFPQCQGAKHSNVHTKDYYAGLRKRLELAYDEGCGEGNGVRGVLRFYRDALQNGVIPGPR